MKIPPTKWKLAVLFLCASILAVNQSAACCPVARSSNAVVNADQTVIMVWDAAGKTQHFIRQASFKSDADDVGFIVPTPSRPQLEESGDAAFSTLHTITAPPHTSDNAILPIGCAAAPQSRGKFATVIEEKRVAGFDATVLTAATGADLAAWLRDHGYAYSPEVAAWAHPYLSRGWMMVALKVARPKEGQSQRDLKAAALRLSFKTDRPLFPYREPESTVAARKLGTSQRLLRIYFISDGRYRAAYGNGSAWSGLVMWSGDITRNRSHLLSDLNLPTHTAPVHWWLTEFEDHWPYAPAADDVYFARDSRQDAMQRTAGSVHYHCDLALASFLAVAVLRPFRRRRR